MKPDVASTSKNKLYWIVKGVLVLLMFIFAYAGSVQFNDPDPVFWCVLYGGAVLVSMLDLIGAVSNRALFGVLGGLYGSTFLFWIFRFWPLNIEEQREVGGLCLLMLWGVLSYWNHRSSSLMIQTG